MTKEEKIIEVINIPRMSINTNEESNYSRGIYQMIKDYFKPDFVVLQIGTYEGVTAELFALTCHAVMTIDPYDLGYNFGQESKEDLLRAEIVANKRLSKYDNAFMIKATSQDFFTCAEKSTIFDAIYIDGDHTQLGIKFDLTHAPDFIRPGGFISLHDWGDHTIQGCFRTIIGEPDKIYEDGSAIKKL